MARALTAKTVENIKPAAARLEVPDPGLVGLYLVVQPSGAKSWAVRYRHAGKPKKLTLGRWPVMGLAEARTAASEALQAVEHGNDPSADKRAAKAAQTVDPDRDKFASVVELFVARHLRAKRSGAEVERILRREVVPVWGDRNIGEIGRRDAIEVIDAVLDRGSPIAANRLRAHLSSLFGWAKSRGIIEVNPIEGIRPPAPERSRERVLTDDEIKLFWKACDRMGEPFGPLFKLLLLTGQRRSEVAEMTDSEINGAVWTLPTERTKNADAHSLTLPAAARAILVEVERIKGKAGLIFTTNGTTPVSGFTRAKERLDQEMQKLANGEVIPAFTVHDLRRTAATGMAGLGFPPHVVEAVLNHRSGTRRGVAGVYNRFSYADEKAAALEAWSRRVLLLVEGKPDNVVTLAGARS